MTRSLFRATITKLAGFENGTLSILLSVCFKLGALFVDKKLVRVSQEPKHCR